LIKLTDNEISEGSLESAEDKLSLAVRWNISSSEISPRHKQIQQVRISTYIKMAKKQILLGKARLAHVQLDEALGLGADPLEIEKLRREIPLALAKYLIETNKFGKAGELLLELELEGDYALEISELYRLLLNTKNQFKWDKILALIEQKEFSNAGVEITEWEKNDDAPTNLFKLNDHLLREKTAFTKHINERRILVRSLIDNGNFSGAESKLSLWEKTGEDLRELFKLNAYLEEKKYGSLIFGDKKTGLIWQRDYMTIDWRTAKQYCINLNLADWTSWSLPTQNELLTLRPNMHKLQNLNNTKDSLLFWTSDGYGFSSAFAINFILGVPFTDQKSRELKVRCVRR
jgi:hypothetical protein